MSRYIIVTLAALALAARTTPAGAQSERLAARLDDPTREAVARVVSTARERGLPTEPIVNKVLEGATKHAPSSRIVEAADSLLSRLEQSRSALAPTPTSRDIAAGADALAYGANREALASMRRMRPTGSIAVPLAVLTQLVASGVPVARASRLVAELMRRGARDEQLIALSDDVRWDVAAGAAPEAALDVRTRGLTAVLPVVPATGGTAGNVDALSSTPGNRKP